MNSEDEIFEGEVVHDQPLNSEQKLALQQLEIAQESEKRVKIFAGIMDNYGVDVMVGLLPAAGDIITAIVSTGYLLHEAQKAGMEREDFVKIIWLQFADLLIGVIPILGDITDFFFKANRRSTKIFEEHTARLKQRITS